MAGIYSPLNKIRIQATHALFVNWATSLPSGTTAANSKPTTKWSLEHSTSNLRFPSICSRSYFQESSFTNLHNSFQKQVVNRLFRVPIAPVSKRVFLRNIHMEMRSTCFIIMQIKLIFIWRGLYEDSYWNRGIGNGLLIHRSTRRRLRESLYLSKQSFWLAQQTLN